MEIILVVDLLTLFGALETLRRTHMLGDPHRQFAAAPVREAVRGRS